MTHMQQNSDVLDKVTFLTGTKEDACALKTVRALSPFDDIIIDFLNEVSRELMKNAEAKAYSDVVTFAFWIRKASLLKMKERFYKENEIRLGKGVAFHIAPSNVPVNFAYSFAAGFISGNANVVRVPSKDFPQVRLIVDAFNKMLEANKEFSKYIFFVRYERDKEINDYFSSVCDMRVIWGGDETIAEIRKSPLPPRSGEITFADRYSIAVIDSNTYMEIEEKAKAAEDFYNDTFFTDQNACTSPRLIIWTGNKIKEAKERFWNEEHDLVKKKYSFQQIQGVNKLTSSLLIAAEHDVKVEEHEDNLIVRVKVDELTSDLMNFKDNSGYFFEYDCSDIMDLESICNDKRCQTVAYLGDGSVLLPLIKSGIKGIDRVIPIGKTMDFDMIWDGYDLLSLLSRTVVIL